MERLLRRQLWLRMSPPSSKFGLHVDIDIAGDENVVARRANDAVFACADNEKIVARAACDDIVA